ncbi:Npl6p KNAG_0E02450 [Huiozyma naganishii CBS 8797]|uniref:Chromatin structure-remodeling complex subunit RSC7 n=1 Tax=Huiozyma naganishii (strain ATCC MYA-139 / BCRC 22969 / CBS 8797 / KCTC 17520 / NBRC 10181 / NCYC 3082 / Yp74L-3) TaxID=1071383 RepID=J7R6N8_HUIN7|nr:hypothetical protein KNAG_0E02450 [Kazachstania naganishii CBS 8797]CCK70505.1 hypothetical protein KNAG_0E02450 [Kazachstania naganishii CBS 8797]
MVSDNEGSVGLDREGSALSRSRSRSNRPNYKIEAEDVDIGEGHARDDDDDEYQEDVDMPDQQDDHGGVRDDDEDYSESASRKRNIRRVEEDDEDEDDEDTGAQPKANLKTEGRSLNSVRSDDERSRSNSIITTPTPAKLKRMRNAYPVDEKGDAIPVVDGEYVLPDDPSGEEKITKDGDLLGGREFKVRTFTLTEKGDRKFMLSTEPARAVGFRDSYLFFQYHPNMFKFVLNQEHKNDLIERGYLPYSYRHRPLALVSARSVFREFGHKIIEGGEVGKDDYFADLSLINTRIAEGGQSRYRPKKSDGHRDGQSEHSNSHKGAGTGFSRNLPAVRSVANPARNAVEFFQIGNPVGYAAMAANGLISTASNPQLNSTNWLYQHSAACSRFNSDMYYDRVRVLLVEKQGIRDPYTNTLHIPQNTQSTRVISYQKTSDDGGSVNGITYETKIQDPDVLRPRTGLSAIPSELYEGLVSPEVLEAIKEQRSFESQV